MKKIIISIPAYNEEKTIGRVIKEIKEVLAGFSYDYSFLVLDDGSTDNTIAVAKAAGARVYSNKRNKGLAETFREEMRQCIKLKADIIVHTDADGQYDPTGIPVMIEKVLSGYDLVLGSRFKGRIQHMPFMKWLGNVAFSIVLSQLTRRKLTDTTTGFRAFTRDVASEIEYINTFTYTQEQIIKAAKQGFRIAEVPIYARKTRKSRLFKGPFQYAFRAWVNIIRIYRDYEPLKFFGRAGMVFLIPGILLGINVAWLFLKTGQFLRIGSTILSVLLIMIGIQIISFGLLADMKR
ncbi:MAG: glycosyltransferase family 2 protein [Nanoarchaeota archaeon]|nr:glycosyltransferase family 2 protein [Nanoarchaeota archaeon]